MAVEWLHPAPWEEGKSRPFISGSDLNFPVFLLNLAALSIGQSLQGVPPPCPHLATGSHVQGLARNSHGSWEQGSEVAQL
jgi:hypothetical protein